LGISGTARGAAGTVGFDVTGGTEGESEVRPCAGTAIGAGADAGTDTEAGPAALVVVLGEGCECETASSFVGVEAVAVDTFDVLTRGPRVL
jgi:hypothetical protein